MTESCKQAQEILFQTLRQRSFKKFTDYFRIARYNENRLTEKS